MRDVLIQFNRFSTAVDFLLKGKKSSTNRRLFIKYPCCLCFIQTKLFVACVLDSVLRKFHMQREDWKWFQSIAYFNNSISVHELLHMQIAKIFLVLHGNCNFLSIHL